MLRLKSEQVTTALLALSLLAASAEAADFHQPYVDPQKQEGITGGKDFKALQGSDWRGFEGPGCNGATGGASVFRTDRKRAIIRFQGRPIYFKATTSNFDSKTLDRFTGIETQVTPSRASRTIKLQSTGATHTGYPVVRIAVTSKLASGMRETRSADILVMCA